MTSKFKLFFFKKKKKKRSKMFGLGFVSLWVFVLCLSRPLFFAFCSSLSVPLCFAFFMLISLGLSLDVAHKFDGELPVSVDRVTFILANSGMTHTDLHCDVVITGSPTHIIIVNLGLQSKEKFEIFSHFSLIPSYFIYAKWKEKNRIFMKENEKNIFFIVNFLSNPIESKPNMRKRFFLDRILSSLNKI